MIHPTRAETAPARVIVVSGPTAGETHAVHDRLTIGRRPENRLRLEDEHASRFHALIEQRNGEWIIEDVGSRSGTRVNGAPIKQPVKLTDRSQITIGQTVLRFRLGDPVFDDPVTLPEVVAVPRSDSMGRGGGTQLPRPTTEMSVRMTVVDISDGLTSAEIEKESLVELRRTSLHLRTLLAANTIISNELELDRVFDRVLDALFDIFPAHRAAVLTSSSDQDSLVVRATRLSDKSDPSRSPQISNSIAYRALRERVGVLTHDAGSDTRFDANASIVDQGIRSAICAPMIHHEEVLGVIYLDTLGFTHPFREGDLRLLSGIASAAAGAVRNARLVRRLRDTAVDTLLRLAVAAEYRDGDTGFHIHRMSDYAVAVGRALGKSDHYCETLKLASPMHDVGKIGIPDNILKKPGKLTVEEFEIMKEHTTKGGAILANPQSEPLAMARLIALSHHEKYDGSGYPSGLLRQHIPLEGRIVAVADVFDAVVSRRCYKPAYDPEEAFELVREGRGKHFDPVILDAFFGVKEEILRIFHRYQELESEARADGRDLAGSSLLVQEPWAYAVGWAGPTRTDVEETLVPSAPGMGPGA